ncbi:hypothetical protein [Planctomyces sp. SH-PL62]|uniref:hypothetical protein n=1 Tax=Planctomyces sp. SH-PL62 TaxID=1636152 RepID=UPI000838C605|nr:hypothetical protein [Planctomyces sp. SH-PL62]
MARRLGIPVRTWYNYEGGVTVPAEVVLKIIELTSVEPTWLLHGKGPKFRPSPKLERGDGSSQPTMMVGALLRTALQLLEGEASPELGSATAKFLDSERSLPVDKDAEPADAGPPAVWGDRDTLQVDRSRGEREWLAARREGRCLPVADDAMAPVLVAGSSVAYADSDESSTALDGRMVVAWVDGVPMVRWFQDRGDHGLLRAEDVKKRAVRIPLKLDGKAEAAKVRRVLWIEASR